MKEIQLGSNVKSCYRDILCIVLIIGLNPITYFFPLSPGIFPPDIFAYAAMAKDLFQKGLLYLPSWGHIDNGLILPPLYPFLIACGRIFSNETLNIAEYISNLSMIIFAIPTFLYIRKMASRLVAVVAMVIIQINYRFFLIGMKPLPESLFLLMIALTLWLMLLFFPEPSRKQRLLSFVLGISCSFVFLSRQIGLIIFVFVGILFIIQYKIISGNNRRELLKNYLFTGYGAMALLIPYTLALYLQTSQHPLTQGFRKNEYVIKVDDPELLDSIAREKDLSEELLELIESQPDKDYGIIYAERRRMRKLLPDASEMYAYALSANNSKTDKRINAILANFNNPGAYFVRLYKNILHIKSAVGWVATILFFLFCFLSIAFKKDKNRDLSRFLLPSFVIFYLLILSLLTDKISRYTYILFPFFVIYISIESYGYLKQIRAIFKTKLAGHFFLVFLFSLILLTTPAFFTGLNIGPKYKGLENEYGYDFKKIVKGEPVFSLFAFEAYIIGSPYRILPNDSLEKVAVYGKKTGVRWILLFHGQSSASELKLYNNLDWFSNRLLESTYPDLVKFRLGTTDGAMALYEIL